MSSCMCKPRVSINVQQRGRFTVSTIQNVRPRRVVAAAGPQQKSGISDAIKEATETCDSKPSSPDCAVAWDNVEELSAAAADKRSNEKAKAALPENDPLEKFCQENPLANADECRVYED